MCLLTLILPGAEARPAYWETAARANPDGFGWALDIGREILRFRSMDYRTAADSFHEARDHWPDAVGLFHWRFATGGTVDRSMCHPFRWGTDRRLAVGHNGVLPIPATATDSDTARFAAGLADIPPSALDNAVFMAELGRWASGSKLAILSAHPDTASRWYLVNESNGHWASGVWYSNRSYLPRPVWEPVAIAKRPDPYRAAVDRVNNLERALTMVGEDSRAAAVIARQLDEAIDELTDIVAAEDSRDGWAERETVDCFVCGGQYLGDYARDLLRCPDCDSCGWCDSAPDACRCLTGSATTGAAYI